MYAEYKKFTQEYIHENIHTVPNKYSILLSSILCRTKWNELHYELSDSVRLIQNHNRAISKWSINGETYATRFFFHFGQIDVLTSDIAKISKFWSSIQLKHCIIFSDENPKMSSLLSMALRQDRFLPEP